MRQPFFITTAIDYVNGSPHIGHALEKVYADAISRYKRLQGKRVFFSTGTDEHGSKIVKAAEQRGVDVKEFVASNRKVFIDMDALLDVEYDYFIQTTDAQKHWKNAEKMWNLLDKNGDIYKKQYAGLYCVGHEQFVTQKDLTPEGKCDIHGSAPERIEEENYFFKLSKYTEPIQQAIQNGEMNIIPKERENEIMSLLNEGLEDVSFSRPAKDLQWGIPVPNDSEHTMYVWADALTNYLSVLDWVDESEVFVAFWPAELQIIGKDILRFHAAIWPGMLLSAGLPLPKCILTHGFISVEGTKMSKSLNNIVDPFALVKEYGTDAVRYYLLSEFSFTKDGDFSHARIKERYNADLAFGIGNFIARVTTLGEKHISEEITQAPTESTQQHITQTFETYHKQMGEYHINEAIATIQSLVAFGDKLINNTRLWELAEKDIEQFKTHITDLAHIGTTVAYMLFPIIPQTTRSILERFGVSNIEDKDAWQFVFKTGDPLFQHKS